MPGIKRIRFFMTFGQSYLTHLKCLENVGMTSIEPIMYEGKEIVPLQFLKAVLPDPASLDLSVLLEKRISDAFSRVRRMEKRRSITYIISVIIRSATKRLVPRRSPTQPVYRR